MQAKAESDPQSDYVPTTPTRVSWVWRVLMLSVIVMVVVATVAWFSRERIAENLIDAALADAGLEASYDIVSIGTQRQSIANLVIGDPEAPDFTAERVDVDLTYSLGAARIGRVQVTRPRLFGAFRDGKLSLGSLDPLIYAPSDAPPGLPEFDIAIIDGRAMIESDWGPIGAKLDGAGRLDDGFAGVVAITAPGIGVERCSAERATIYGDLTTARGRVGFAGPMRLGEADCEGVSLQSADIAAQLSLSEDFTAVEGDFDLAAASLKQGEMALGAINGTADVAWAFAGELSLRHDLAGKGLTTPYAQVDSLDASGTLRSTGGLARAEWDADLSAQGIDVAQQFIGLTDARAATKGTFAGTLLAKMDDGLAMALANGEAAASAIVRIDDGQVRAVMPEARLRSANGETILALSRLSYSGAAQDRPQRLTGNILTGGAGLPRINGRMEQIAGGDIALRATMAEYREGADALSIPRLELRQDNRGNLTFNAMVQAEGAIPGGDVRGLIVPLEGTWSQASGLSIARRCTEIEIGGLQTYDLVLEGRKIALCPVDRQIDGQAGGGAIATYTDSFRFNARTNDVQLIGKLADTPTRIAVASAVINYPGPFRIEALDATIGPPDNAVRLTAKGLEGSFAQSIAGRFEEGTAAIDAVPLDLSELAGKWSYADGALRIGQGAFTLSERIDPANGPFARFEPVTAQGATLILDSNVITAKAGLRHPDTASPIADITIRHNLSSGRGRADIDVPGLRFTESFQPEDLSFLAKGVIAFADGTITGAGDVMWSPDSLESTGTFGTESFDFAAAFGPVREVSGTIVFTDLIGLTTAPSQTLRIGSINTGVEVLDGKIVYSITDGTQITVDDGRWPFMGGELILRPVTLDYGGQTGQSYIFELVALDAATFVAQMELTNLGATGTFDGAVPIVFDAGGNGTIAGGLLISRPPGGNVAYVGELTYEDLGAMGNYAFQTLRSLDYNQMSIELNGNLAGEILTQFKIDGVRQGAGTSQNFITRQLAQLPIRFNVNVRSDNFYLLSKVVKGFFDPTIFDDEMIRDQLGIGAFAPISDAPSTPVEPEPEPAPTQPLDALDAQRRDEPAVQPSESEPMP